MVTIGMLASRVRHDEKMILAAARERGVDVDVIDDRALTFGLSGGATRLDPDARPAGTLDAGNVDVVLERSISYWHSYYASRHLEQYGIPVINSHDVIRRCGDKAETSLLLEAAGVATPRVRLALDEASALRACEEIGYPVVLKPVVGSWGRLICRADTPEQAQALIEHKKVLGGPQHGVFYVQELVEKPDRDARLFMVDGEVVAGIWRWNDGHFITNTAQGGHVTNCEITDDIRDVCERASHAIGGGILAMDLMENPDGSLTCHEVNHTMEFKNSVKPTGVDIPGRIIEHLVEVAKS